MAFQTIAKNALEQETEVGFFFLAINACIDNSYLLVFQAELINDFPDQIRLNSENNRPGNADNCQC